MNDLIDKLRDLFLKKLPGKTEINVVINKLPEYLEEIPKDGDIYLNFAMYSAKVLMALANKVNETNISALNVMNKLLMAVFSWGIYPHLPKSLHFKFASPDEHWLKTTAPPRLLRPPDEMMDAILAVFTANECGKLHQLFLHHAIGIFYYLDKDKLNKIIEYQQTDKIIGSLIALLADGMNTSAMLSSIIMQRSDSLEALESTVFPPKLCASAISMPPKGEDENLYYRTLFPRLIAAINTKKGGVVAQYVIGYIITRKREQFLANFDVSALINWPNPKSVGPVLWNLNNIVNETDIKKVLTPPMPQRVVFIAATTTGEIYNQAVKLIKRYMLEEKETIDLIRSVVEVASLCPLGLDEFRVVSSDEGVFIYSNDDEDDQLLKQMSILEEMRIVLASSMDLKFSSYVIESLPISMEGFHFLSQLLSRYKELNEEIAVLVLSYVSNLQNYADVATEIAANVVQLCPNLKKVPQKVLDSFLGERIPRATFRPLFRCLLSERSESFPDSKVSNN